MKALTIDRQQAVLGFMATEYYHKPQVDAAGDTSPAVYEFMPYDDRVSVPCTTSNVPLDIDVGHTYSSSQETEFVFPSETICNLSCPIIISMKVISLLRYRYGNMGYSDLARYRATVTCTSHLSPSSTGITSQQLLNPNLFITSENLKNLAHVLECGYA